MTEPDLLIFGCAVMFIAIAGAYVFVREQFVYSEQEHEEHEEAKPVPDVASGPQSAHDR